MKNSKGTNTHIPTTTIDINHVAKNPHKMEKANSLQMIIIFYSPRNTTYEKTFHHGDVNPAFNQKAKQIMRQPPRN